MNDGTVTVGTQMDMWEFGTSRAAAWDSPTTIQFNPVKARRHPRLADLMEVMRRWEDVRARNWLTEEQRRILRDPKREFHLYQDEAGNYELVEWHQLSVAGAKDSAVRAFVFERKGRRVVAYWHVSGKGELDLGASVGKLMAENLAYWTTDLSVAEVKRLFENGRMTDGSDNR